MIVRKFPVRLGACVAMLLSLAVVGCAEQAQQTGTDKSVPEVGVVTLEAQRVELFTSLPGRTAPYRVAEVRPQVEGIVEKRLFKQGSHVDSGQTLYRIDQRPYRTQVKSAQADLAKARAAVSSVKLRAQRFGDLLQDHAVSQQEYDDIRSTLAQNSAQVDIAEAALAAAKLNLDYTTVRAPISGIIGASLITEGGLVTANQPNPLTQITQLDPIYVDVTRSTSEVLRLKREFKQGTLEKAGPESAKVEMFFDDGTQYAHSGKLKFSGVTVDPSTGAITLRAVFPNPEGLLLPGMYVTARLSEGVSPNALLAPQQGITHDEAGRPTALVVTDDNKVESRQLETREAIGSFWLVNKGLQAGDKLIVTGLHHAEPGAQVKPVAADIPNQGAGSAVAIQADDTDRVEAEKPQPDTAAANQSSPAQ